MKTMASRLDFLDVEGRRRLRVATAVLFSSYCVQVGNDHRVNEKAEQGCTRIREFLTSRIWTETLVYHC